MNDLPRNIWFWQRIISPHMAGLAASLAQQGYEVKYIAEQMISQERANQGWLLPEVGLVKVSIANSISGMQALANSAPIDSIHICQGIRQNGLVIEAQRKLAQRGLRQFIIMEKIDDSRWRGVFKKVVYGHLLKNLQQQTAGVLAIGLHTASWIIERGMPAEKVFPFSYFLSENYASVNQGSPKGDRFRFIFVGQFIKKKGLDLLLSALTKLERRDFELVVIGSGPLEAELRLAAESLLPERVSWIGRLPMNRVAGEISNADCLVLPSRFDGWGVVVSEALMAGTPAVCSDRCGAAIAVYASKVGGVFSSGKIEELTNELSLALKNGRLTLMQRIEIAEWAKCLSANAGAKYFQQILSHLYGDEPRPDPPWNIR